MSESKDALQINLHNEHRIGDFVTIINVHVTGSVVDAELIAEKAYKAMDIILEQAKDAKTLSK